jgi:hypothetical protein
LCLDLAHYYGEQRDLSHMQHCVATVAALLRAHPDALAGAAEVHADPCDDAAAAGGQQQQLLTACASGAPPPLPLAVLLQYHMASAAALRLKLLLCSAPGARALQLYRNPAFPPEEFVNAAMDAGDASSPVSPWSGPDARIDFGVDGVPPPQTMLQVEGTAAEFGAALRREIAEAVAGVGGGITIDNDCERFVRLARLEADADGALMALTGERAFGLSRLASLERVLTMGLNQTVFRNVLRQADFDTGTTATAVADHADTAALPPPERRALLETALGAFARFGDAMRREIALAKKSNVAMPLEGADLHAYVLADMRRAQTLMALGRREEARAAFAAVDKFLGAPGQRAAMRASKALREQRSMCAEVAALLASAMSDSSNKKK